MNEFGQIAKQAGNAYQGTSLNTASQHRLSDEAPAERSIDNLKQQVRNLGLQMGENSIRIQQIAARLGFQGNPQKESASKPQPVPNGAVDEVRAMIEALQGHEHALVDYLNAIERQV